MPNTPISRLRVGRPMSVGWIFLTVCALAGTDCRWIPRGSTEQNDLSAMQQVSIKVVASATGVERATYTAYVADTNEMHVLGLMNVTEDELPADHGMIFVFSTDRHHSFWMRNTVIPLDIAYIQSDGSDGRIVKIYTMEPLNEAGYPSIEPARFALEVRGGQFAQWGITEGDRVEIPDELFD